MESFVPPQEDLQGLRECIEALARRAQGLEFAAVGVRTKPTFEWKFTPARLHECELRTVLIHADVRSPVVIAVR